MSATKMFAVRLSAACTTLNVGAATFYVNALHPNDSGMETSWESIRKTNQAAVGVSVANVKCRE